MMWMITEAVCELRSHRFGETITQSNERLKVLDIPTVELRRLQDDLIYCYKIIFCIDAVDCNDLFTLNTLIKALVHACKLYKPQCTRGIRRNFFSVIC